MNRVFQTIAASLVFLLLVGCGVKKYPTIPPGAPVNVGIVSMSLKPQHPLPGERWRAAMVVKNHQKKDMIKDIGYIMRIPEKNMEIGRGDIGKMVPDDCLTITSDDVQLPPGKYQVEAVLYMPTGYQVTGNPIRAVMTVSDWSNSRSPRRPALLPIQALLD